MSQRNYADVATKNAGVSGGSSVFIDPHLKNGHFSFYKKGDDGNAIEAKFSSITGFLDGVSLDFEDGKDDFAPSWVLKLKLEIPCTAGTRLIDFKTDEVPGGYDANGNELPAVPIIKGVLKLKGDRVNAMRKVLNPILGTLAEQGLAWNGLLSLWFSANQKKTTQMDLFVKTNATTGVKSPLIWAWDDDSKSHTGLPPVVSTGVIDSQGNEVKDSRAQMNALLDAAKLLFTKFNPSVPPPAIPHVVRAYKLDGVTKATIFGGTTATPGTLPPQQQAQPQQVQSAPSAPTSVITDTEKASYINTFKVRWATAVANGGGDQAFYANTQKVIGEANTLIAAAANKLAPILGLLPAFQLSFELFKLGTKLNEKFQLTLDESTGKVSAQPGAAAATGADDLPF